MKVVVLGATSTIARTLVRELAKPGDTFILAARDSVEGPALAADLQIRTGAAAIYAPLDVSAPDALGPWMQDRITQLNGLDGVVLCVGHLGNVEVAARDWKEARTIIDVNFTSALALLEPAAAFLEQQNRGYLLALSSVAGIRGRRSNYHYGAAKGALTLFLEGLAHRLAPSGVQVKIAKLGFVESAMTAGLPMTPWLRCTPERAVHGILRLLHSPAQSAFIPWIWRPIMAVVRLLPARIFNRTKL